MSGLNKKPEQISRQLDVTPDPQVLELFAALEIPAAGCLAELIDNSVDGFRLGGTEGGLIDIQIEHSKLTFSDNGPGMTLDELERSLKAGSSSKRKVGELGLFGIGFNLATMKLGVQTTVFTKTEDDKLWNKVVINVRDMIKENSFKIDSSLEDIDLGFESGTYIELKLRKEFAGALGRQKSIRDLRASIGRRYTFILRTKVFGLEGDVAHDKRDFVIRLNTEKIKPFMPCIWNADRKMANGEAAVQLIDKRLVETQVCQDCRTEMPIEVSSCESCGGQDLIEQPRRIWGWLGVQRCLETEEYGVDLIRNGRTIEEGCKDFFKFKDPDTGSVENEYPIEQTNRGRIVGEIHCDHVPVEFTKQSFERTQSFNKVQETLRGTTWLRPQYAVAHCGERNESPMAVMFSGVRRIDPGTKYLTPGNGKKAILVEAKNWVKKFHAGDPDYETDQKWWDACVSHEKPPQKPPIPATVPPSGPSPLAGPNPTLPTSSPHTTPANKKEKTIKELADQWKAGARKRPDLSKPIYLKVIEHKFEMEVYETVSKIIPPGDTTERAAFLLPTSGANFEIYVNRHHPLIDKWGRQTTDIALGEASNHLYRQGKRATYSVVFAELIENFPDEEDSEITIRARCEELKKSIRTILPKQIEGDSTAIWSEISETERIKITQTASDHSKMDINKLSEAGAFGQFVTWRALTEIIAYRAELVFGGRVFTQALGGNIPTLARERVISNTISAISDLIIFEVSGEGISKLERQKAAIAIEFLYDRLSH